MKRAALPILILLWSVTLWAETGLISGKDVSVRSAPSASSEVLLQLEQGRRVQLLDRKGAWLKIRVALDPT